MERRHALLPYRIHAGEALLRFGDGRIVDIADQILCRVPGRLCGLAHDHMQPDAEIQPAPALFRRARGTAEFLRDQRGGSPQVR